ncbi:MAG: hypothetical protein WA211_15515 [Candidatus Acidiferrales bacterium]
MKKKICGSLLVALLLLGSAAITAAQEKPGLMPAPKVLSVIREFVKPGKAGSAHEKTERGFVDAMTAANSPSHYIALDSLSGVSRSLFLSGYDSFAQWEEQVTADLKNPLLSAELDRAAEADGALLSGYESGLYILREDQSYNTKGGIAHMRYFEITVYRIKPGHEADWDAIVKLVKPALIKANPDDNWAMYERAYGAGGPAFVVFHVMKSAAEIDQGYANNPKFAAAMGEDGMKQLSALSAAAIEGSESNLFIINPRMSYVGTDLINADPGFWKTSPQIAVPAGQTDGTAASTERPAQ